MYLWNNKKGLEHLDLLSVFYFCDWWLSLHQSASYAQLQVGKKIIIDYDISLEKKEGLKDLDFLCVFYFCWLQEHLFWVHNLVLLGLRCFYLVFNFVKPHLQCFSYFSWNPMESDRKKLALYKNKEICKSTLLKVYTTLHLLILDSNVHKNACQGKLFK